MREACAFAFRLRTTRLCACRGQVGCADFACSEGALSDFVAAGATVVYELGCNGPRPSVARARRHTGQGRVGSLRVLKVHSSCSNDAPVGGSLIIIAAASSLEYTTSYRVALMESRGPGPANTRAPPPAPRRGPHPSSAYNASDPRSATWSSCANRRVRLVSSLVYWRPRVLGT